MDYGEKSRIELCSEPPNFMVEMKELPRKTKIAVMGAGAIGSVIGGMLARNGNRVALVGRKPHIDEIRKNGLHINGIWGDGIETPYNSAVVSMVKAKESLGHR